ncbi:hypothetical protein ACFV4N_34385 [Actinosynnema sp. NPDC059797]
MTSTSTRPPTTAGPRVGHLVGAVVDAVLLTLINGSPGWRAVPFLTDDAVEVVVWVDTGLALGVVVNTLCALFPRRRLVLLGEVLTTTATLAAPASVSAVWPFNFEDAQIPWTTIRRSGPRRRLAMALAAEPGSHPTSTLVSKACAVTWCPSGARVSSHSRTPRPVDTRSPVAWSAADRRVVGRLRPKACVGAPTTSRPTSSGRTSGASETSTTSAARASLTASAMVLVLPNMDS